MYEASPWVQLYMAVHKYDRVAIMGYGGSRKVGGKESNLWQNFKFPMNQEHRSLKSGADLWQHLAGGRWTVNMWVTLHYLFMGPGLIQPAATTHTQPRSWTAGAGLVEMSTGILKFPVFFQDLC